MFPTNLQKDIRGRKGDELFRKTVRMDILDLGIVNSTASLKQIRCLKRSEPQTSRPFGPVFELVRFCRSALCSLLYALVRRCPCQQLVF